MLWNYLKNFQVRGYDFDRQRPIGNYIVDFYCKDLMLAIEEDGESHYFKEEKDKLRQRTIEGFGVKFLRFEDTDILYKLDEVIKTIEKWVDENAPQK